MRCYSTWRELGCHATVQLNYEQFWLAGNLYVADVVKTQMMRCIIYHLDATNSNLYVRSSTNSSHHSTTCSIKIFLYYNVKHGSTSTKKHLVNDHGNDWEWFKLERKAKEAITIEGKNKSKKCKGMTPPTWHNTFGLVPEATWRMTLLMCKLLRTLSSTLEKGMRHCIQ